MHIVRRLSVWGTLLLALLEPLTARAAVQNAWRAVGLSGVSAERSTGVIVCPRRTSRADAAIAWSG
jgi:hypothetical protein